MKRLSLLAGLVAAIVFGVSGTSLAQYTSSNYKSNEVFFGTGGDNNQSSANYKASASVGSLGVGNYASTNYKVYSGFLTPNEPFLEMQIDTTNVNLGTLDANAANTGTSTFHVRAYVDSGYTVQTISSAPTYTSGATSHTLAAMSLGASSPGTEQFGINLVHNTSPANFGTDPSPQPSSSFATGVAAAGYDTTNQFKYHAGDIIAQTPSGSSGWGLTIYTISYIANISLLTPAGNYTMVHDLVIVATF
jgi:hypothetical protein